MPSTQAATVRPRRFPAPVTDPPFDDELRPPTPAPQRRKIIGGGRPQVPRQPGGEHARRTPPSTALPDPHRWCRWFARMVLEVLYGHRPIPQLVRWTSEDVYGSLTSRAARRRAAGAVATPSVRLVRVCVVRRGVMEAAVVLQAASRARALAVRFEARDGRWLCTALDLI